MNLSCYNVMCDHLQLSQKIVRREFSSKEKAAFIRMLKYDTSNVIKSIHLQKVANPGTHTI
jgi:hypothetical protein